MKTCAKCGETKPFEEFHKAAQGKNGLKASCKTCCRTARADWYKANPEKRLTRKTPEQHRTNHLWSKYRLRPADWEAMYEAQGKKCAGCGRRTRQLQVDHEHACCPGRISCGKCVRGLLCKTCNTRRLPMIEGSHHLVESLTAYLADPPAYRILNRKEAA